MFDEVHLGGREGGWFYAVVEEVGEEGLVWVCWSRGGLDWSYVGRVVVVLGDAVGDGLLLGGGGGGNRSGGIDGLGGILRLLHGHLAVEEG